MNDMSRTPRAELLKIVREKHEALKEIMVEEGIDCWLVFLRETAANPDPVQNLILGGDVVWETAIIFHHTEGSLSKQIVIGNFDAAAEKNKEIWDEVLDYKEGISDVLKQQLEIINPKNIALNFSEDDVTSDGLSHGMFLKLTKILPSMINRFESAERIIQKLRSRKTTTELELLTKACQQTEVINKAMQEQFTIGMTEIAIQKMFHEKMDAMGVIESWQRNSCPAIDAGPDKEMGHVGPSELKIAKGHSLHNDFGIMLHGYASDIQRMWFFGKREDIPDELLNAFDTVYGAISAAAAFIKPGVMGYEVDKAARDFVVSNGYEEYAHALGHQVGMKAHDGGTLLGPLWERYGDLPKGRIEENNVFTFELYVKTEHYGMVSLEEEIVVTKDGCRFLIPRQEEWICVDV